ncbi:beta-galactosidase [Dactylosporangium sp. AC04546]|uniref:beta-galactosidase n=1 Tax=Dactylosporangium sp. AC04546 TaxID=2862460 RepID=UPI001EDD8880|nr:beta-galactosidase [Dactylosporangium sp. AC04546]WVK88079.1 beta-galactosidase [Dactylosporangium sp. AC04546]
MTVMFGGDYNPEQWPESVWDEDMRLMTEAGVSLVSVGIFSWASVEPRPGEYDFGWFDRVLDKLAANGIGASLATMTASPPPWLARLHPETLPQRADGVRLWPGGRQQYCPSSPVYRDHAARLVESLASRYHSHPALRIWHIGNEYGCHVRSCWCDVSAADFRRWLRERYGDLDALNAAWSTTFWSQRYGDWEEILPPRTAPTFANPAQKLDFARFSDDAILACYTMERDIVRRHTPAVPVTTNFIGLVHKPIDSYRWAREQDVVSLDSYPDPYDPRAHVDAAFAYDLARSARGGQPWLLMEQAPSAVNWRPRNAPKPPGVMRLWSWQAVAQGADAVLFFQWRQSAGGAEKFHSAMVPHAGPSARGFADVRALGRELALVPSLGRVSADVAVVHDWDSWRALESDAHPAELDLLETHRAHYAPLFEAHVTVDVVPVDADFSRYKLVVVPNLYLMTSSTAARLTEYVASGGHLVVSFFSGIVDECDRVHLGGYPAPLREVLGLTVDEFWPLSGAVPLSQGAGSVWAEWVELSGASAVATFDGGDLAGRPAITRHEFGAGVAWYLATRPDPATMRELFDRIRRDAGVRPVVEGLPDPVQAVARGSHLFLLNHGTTPTVVDLPSPGVDLLDPAAVGSKSVTLAPRGVAVVKLEEVNE